MAKKDLVIFSLDTLLTPGGRIAPGADTIINSDAFLKGFIASEKDDGFTWEKVAKLNLSRSFSGHCVSNARTADDYRYLLANLVGWICRSHEVGRKFFLARSETDLEHGKNLGLVGIKIEGERIAVEELFTV
jgi:hypothetical protein